MDSEEDKRHWEREKKERFPCLPNADPEKHVAMGTKGFSWNLFGSLQFSGQNLSVSSGKRKDHAAQGSCPKSDTAVQTVRQRESDQEDEWRRQREIEKSKEWMRERARGMAHGHREREKKWIAQEREERHIKSEKEVRRQNERLASERTGKERLREGGTFHQIPKTSREQMTRLIKNMCKEGDGRTKPPERQREKEREEISERGRRAGRPRDEQRDMKRQSDWNREKEYRKKGGGVRDKEVRPEQREIRKEPSPRYRQREVWEEKELQGERERGRGREKEGGRVNQYEKSRGHCPAERQRIPEIKIENFSDREGWERKRQRQRVTKSDGDGEGDILQGRETDFQRGLQQKHSRSEGDSEERVRERYMDGWRYKERDMQRVKEEDKAKAKYREMEGRRENDRYRDRVIQMDMERYEGRQRYRGPETLREGTKPRIMGNGQNYVEKGRDHMKYSREEWEKHHSPGRERRPKNREDRESKNIDEHWTDTRSRSRGYGSDVDYGKKEKERQTTQDKRQRPSRIWIDSQKEGLEFAEREATHEECVDEDIQMPMNEGKFTGGEERVSEWEENEGNGQGAEKKAERGREDEDKNDKRLRRETFCDGDLESEDDAQSKKREDIKQNLETEDVIGSTDEGGSEVGNASEEYSPSENEGESESQEGQEERMEDDLAAVSSSEEEEHEETVEDGNEFLECVATFDEDLQSAEYKRAEEMEKGREQQEKDDGDRTLEGEHESTKMLIDMGEDLDMKRSRMDEVWDSKVLEGKKSDDDDSDDGDGDDDGDDDGDGGDGGDDDGDGGDDDDGDGDDDGDDDGDGGDGGDDDGDGGDDDDGDGDDDDRKVTVFFVVGQTLRKNKELQQTEELNKNQGPDTSSVPPLADSENVTDREKEVERDTEKSDDESHLDTLCVSKKPHGDENSEIPLESKNSKDTDQYLNEIGGHECSENGRIDMSEENESGTENTSESYNEAKRHTVPCLELTSESSDGGENESMFTANRKPDKEPCSDHESDNQRQTESISQTTDESTFGNDVEQCKEEASPCLKSLVDVTTEISGASEDGPNEKQEECSEKDTQDTSEPITNCDNNKETEECVQIKTRTYSDMLTINENEEMKNSALSTDVDVESDPNTVVSVEGENAQVGTDVGIQMTVQDESCIDSETDQICHSPITKRTLSKSDSCPSPVSSPSKAPLSAAEKDAEKRYEMQNEEMEDSEYFEYQAYKALSRRRMCRKATDRCKDGEDWSGRVSGSRVFDISEDDDKLSLSCGEAELRTLSDSLRRPKKKNSRFFNSQLYQEYSEVVQNQEILLQSCSDATSPTLPAQLSRRPLPPVPSIPHPHSLYQFNSLPNPSTRSLPLLPPPRSSSPRLSASFSQSPILWQDLPGVRNSSELSDLDEDERRLQEVRFEVVTSEASYCRSLDIAVGHFVKSKQLGALLSAQDKNWLFSRLGDVRNLSHSFLFRLEEQIEADVMHFTVCDIIIRYCPRFRSVYVPYLTNQSYQDKTYQRLMDECPGFRRVVETLERSPVCQRLPLRSFLVLPFQRITRLKLLVQNIVKRSVSNTKEEVQAIKALKLLEKLIMESNDSITQMKSIESLVSLSSKVDFGCKTLPLVSQSRRLIREGSVAEMRDFALKESERTVYLHLFNDYLLLSLQKESGRFSVIDYAPTVKIRVENCRVKLHSLQKNVFRLHLTPQRALLLRTDTHSDKLRWMSALSRPHPDIDFTMAQDLTQVQCVRAFVAQQPDEISLEKADVILVHQQSSDGWVEGTRLSDRQRGWAPQGHLETIVNARARQRNLLDTQKIKTATATH